MFSFLLPAALFFPAMVASDVILSGNVAYILYGLVLGGAGLGWVRGRWTAFYLAVFIASCFKAPMLSLVAIAPLSTRRQWVPAGITALAGVGAFAVQLKIWPTLFRHYIEAVELQFSLNHDFGASPAGLIANALSGVVPYQVASTIVYILSATVVGALLLFLRRRYLEGRFQLRQWVPVMLCGVVLLNPRIMEYDAAVLPLLVALAFWRALGRAGSPKIRAVAIAVIFVALNTTVPMPNTGYFSWDRMAIGVAITGAFAAGCWDLSRYAKKNGAPAPSA